MTTPSWITKASEDIIGSAFWCVPFKEQHDLVSSLLQAHAPKTTQVEATLRLGYDPGEGIPYFAVRKGNKLIYTGPDAVKAFAEAFYAQFDERGILPDLPESPPNEATKGEATQLSKCCNAEVGSCMDEDSGGNVWREIYCTKCNEACEISSPTEATQGEQEAIRLAYDALGKAKLTSLMDQKVVLAQMILCDALVDENPQALQKAHSQAVTSPTSPVPDKSEVVEKARVALELWVSYLTAEKLGQCATDTLGVQRTASTATRIALAAIDTAYPRK